MDVTIEQSCPSCGASIVLGEDSRLIKCSYCDVNNYRIENSGARYTLPCIFPDTIVFDKIFYIPYLRFKGTIFYVHDGEVGYRIVDTTRLGIEENNFPVSLGLRPQAMQLLPMVSSMKGAFIDQTIATKTVFIHAAMVTEIFSGTSDKMMYHRAFIGETLSRIYQPCFIHAGNVYDAVTRKIIGPETLLTKYKDQATASKKSWEPQFISTICPQCGALLSGESDSLVLHCRNCASLWQENNKQFWRLPWLVGESKDPSARYLPFWKITFSTQGLVLQSFGDYLRFTNQPIVVDEKADGTPLAFWVPAFKLNPKAFLQVASQLTIGQRRIPVGETRQLENYPSVTLSQKEAIQAIKSILAATTLSKGKRFPFLPKMTIVDAQCMLNYLPFIKQSNDYIQEHTRATLLAAALRFGRSL